MNSFFSTKHFILLMATLMGFTAFMIDSILPAFPEMTEFYGLRDANLIHNVVFAYFLGNASTQLLFGLMGDSLGRKKTLLLGFIIYIFASLSLIFTSDFNYLLLGRFLQGAGLAAPRVMVNAIVRDVSSGNRMAQTLSYIMMVFMAVPVLAPSLGQLILKLGDFKTIFHFYWLSGLLVLLWFTVKLPETLKAEQRKPFSLAQTRSALALFFKNKAALLYLIISALLFSILTSYISQAEQIFARDVYRLGDLFPYVFASVASGIIIAAFLNGKLVMKYGMQRMLAGSLIGLLLLDGLLLLLTLLGAGQPLLIPFVLLLAGHFICYSQAMNNLNALLMQSFAAIAGVAAALFGTLMTIGGVLLGGLISRQYNGTVYPLVLGFFLAALVSFFLNRLAHRLAISG